MPCPNHCDCAVITAKMQVKHGPCKCHAVITQQNPVLLWSKHNHDIKCLFDKGDICQISKTLNTLIKPVSFKMEDSSLLRSKSLYIKVWNYPNSYNFYYH